MSGTAVIYFSKHGAAKQYAEWIAEDTGADLFDGDHVKPAQLERYPILVVGGGIYSGGILGMDWLRKNRRRHFARKKIVVFGVGVSVGDAENRRQAAKINFTGSLAGLPYCFLPGAFDPASLSGFDKRIIKWTTKMIREGDGNAFSKTLLGYFENGCDLIDRGEIEPIVDKVREYQEEEFGGSDLLSEEEFFDEMDEQ